MATDGEASARHADAVEPDGDGRQTLATIFA
jgi:hypothetical protein